MQLSSVSKSMNISRIHQKFAYCLEKYHNISKQQVLTNPERYLGSNWMEVLEFWLHLDKLTEQQLKVVEKRYYTLSREERIKVCGNSRKYAKETRKYVHVAGDAAYAAYAAVSSTYYGVSYAKLGSCYATYELIGNVKNPVILPMFYF